MKSVLITGGLGFIGSNIAKKCFAMGLDVTIYDNLDSNSGGNLFNIELFSKEVELVMEDIIDYERLIKVIKDKDIIINCAASTSHLHSMREPWLSLDVNSRGVINLLEAIRKVNSSAKFVHLGTATQLGPLHYQPADELHPEFPTDMYSANKMVAEKYVIIYAKTYSLDATVIRLPNVFGPRAAIHSPEFTFNNYFIGLALQKKAITVFKPGTQLRNVLYVDDAVDAVVSTIKSNVTNGETFFAVGDSHYSVRNIADKTCEVMGGKVKLIDWPKERSVIEIGDAVISNDKINRVLDWTPRIGLEEGLMLTFDFFKDKLSMYLK